MASTRTRNKEVAHAQILPWTYNGKLFTEVPEGAFGFIYLINVIDVTTNQKLGHYIGKKQFHSTRTKKVKLTPAGKRTKRVATTTESDWINYLSSSKELKELAKNPRYMFVRMILQFASHKKQLTYLEMKHQIKYQVLEQQNNTFNRNILNKFFPSDIVPKITCEICQ